MFGELEWSSTYDISHAVSARDIEAQMEAQSDHKHWN